MIVWITGMSGAGKTTIGRALYNELKARNPSTVFIDGDEIREVLKHDGPDDYSVEARRANNDRIRALCAWLDRQEIDVICCILSIFDDALERNRRDFRNYFEVYLRAPMDALTARHPTDLYGRAARGEQSDVVGVDIAFPEPRHPDLILDNGIELLDIDSAVHEIRSALTRLGGG